VRHTIKSAQDLRGKRLGVQVIGGTIWMGAMLGLEHLGLDPRRDGVQIIAAGDQTMLIQALERGPSMLRWWIALSATASSNAVFRSWWSTPKPTSPFALNGMS